MNTPRTDNSSLEFLKSPDAQDFIKEHAGADIRALALKSVPFSKEEKTALLAQIKSRQKACNKLPAFSAHARTLFPSPDLVEQSSSEITAQTKARIIAQKGFDKNTFCDLTSGLGIDAIALSHWFESGICVDADSHHINFLEYNLKVLGIKNVTFANIYAENFIEKMPKVDLAYIDPQRRMSRQNTASPDAEKKGLFDFNETAPNVLEILPTLKEKAAHILIKASPFLDIHLALKQLQTVSDVYVLEHAGQCKEVLYFIASAQAETNPTITSVQCDKGDKGDKGDESTQYACAYQNITANTAPLSDPKKYLYEPGPALMKAAAHVAYAHEKDLHKIAPDTHLYTSNHLLKDYMGRCFEVIGTFNVKDRALYAHLDQNYASITTRNFPLSPDNLRKKLKIKDGGAHTIFACTLKDQQKRLILCKKAV